MLSAAPTGEERAARRAPAVRRSRRRPALLGGGLGGDGAARDRRPARERHGCRSWSAAPACICAPCSTASRRCRRSIPEVRQRVREAPVEENRAEAADARPGRGRAAEAGRHDAHRARARSGAVDRPHARRVAAAARRRDRGATSSFGRSILLPPRDWLYARCDERFAQMVDKGAVAEVEALLARKLNPNLPVMRGDRRARDRGLSARRMHARRSDRGGPAGDAPLRQAAIYLVRPPAAGRMAALPRAARPRPRSATRWPCSGRSG